MHDTHILTIINGTHKLLNGFADNSFGNFGTGLDVVKQIFPVDILRYDINKLLVLIAIIHFEAVWVIQFAQNVNFLGVLSQHLLR